MQIGALVTPSATGNARRRNASTVLTAVLRCSPAKAFAHAAFVPTLRSVLSAGARDCWKLTSRFRYPAAAAEAPVARRVNTQKANPMGDVLDMVTKKRRIFDCQNEAVDLREHFKSRADTRKTESALALSTLVRLMQAEFGDTYAYECLTNERLRVKGRK
jgi:hypothetical protein